MEMNSTSLSKNSWDFDKAVVSLKFENIQKEFTIKYPLPIIAREEEFENHCVFLFKNRFLVKEDHYFEVKIDDKRSGVIFPVSIYSNLEMILSNVSNEKEKEYIFRFLYIAFCKLISPTQNFFPRIMSDAIINSQENLRILDLWDEDTIVWLVHFEGDVSAFKIEKYYPSLFKFGYTPILKIEDFETIQTNIKHTLSNQLTNYNFLSKLKLYTPKSNIYQEVFIAQMFKHTLKYHLPPLSRFMLLYQVIELLIDKIAIDHFSEMEVFNHHLSAMMIKTKDALNFRQLKISLKSIQSKINSATERIQTEESRIRMLLNDKCKLFISEYNVLQQFYKIINPDEPCKDLTDYIYQIRNLIVHNYHRVSSKHQDLEEMMIDMNIELERMLCDVVISYTDNP